jgi:hypothetical protein
MLLFNKLYLKFERTHGFHTIGVTFETILKIEPPLYALDDESIVRTEYRCLLFSISLYKYRFDFYIGLE